MTARFERNRWKTDFFFALSICLVFILQIHILTLLTGGEEEDKRETSNSVDSFHWDRPKYSS